MLNYKADQSNIQSRIVSNDTGFFSYIATEYLIKINQICQRGIVFAAHIAKIHLVFKIPIRLMAFGYL